LNEVNVKDRGPLQLTARQMLVAEVIICNAERGYVSAEHPD